MADKKDIVQDYVGMLEYIIAEIGQLSGAIETTNTAVSLMQCDEDEQRMIRGSLGSISLVCNRIQWLVVQAKDDFHIAIKRLEENDAT